MYCNSLSTQYTQKIATFTGPLGRLDTFYDVIDWIGAENCCVNVQQTTCKSDTVSYTEAPIYSRKVVICCRVGQCTYIRNRNCSQFDEKERPFVTCNLVFLFLSSLSCVSAGEMLSHKRNKTVQERKGRERKERKGSFFVSSVLLFYTPFLACKGAKKTQPNPRARDAPIPPPTAHCLAVFTLFLVRSRRPIDHAFRVEGKAAGRRRPKSAHLFFGGGGVEKKNEDKGEVWREASSIFPSLKIRTKK